MAKFSLSINCGNSAFNDCNMDDEIARILRDVANRIESKGCTGFYETINDNNGNDVGRFALKNDDGSNFNKVVE